MANRPLVKGDRVRCVGARDIMDLTLGWEYLVIKDQEPGIFADRPYVTVQGNYGPVECHAHRFELLEAA